MKNLKKSTVSNIEVKNDDPSGDDDVKLDLDSPSQSIPKLSDVSCNICTINHQQTTSIDTVNTNTQQYKINVTPIIIHSSSIASNSPISYYSYTLPLETPNSVRSNTTYSTASSFSPTVSPSIHFDTNCGQYLIASEGFDSGVHEWTVKILNTDLLQQEIGVVSNFINAQNKGTIRENSNFGSRAIYGNDKETLYYASYNKDNSCRCNKILPSTVKPWCNDDEVKVVLDLEKGSITFFLNDEKVRKSLSIQRNKMYYPIISNSVKCKYEVIKYESKSYSFSHK